MDNTKTAFMISFLVLLVSSSLCAEPRDWTYPPIEITQEEQDILTNAAYFSDAGALEFARGEYQKIADKYQGTSVEANTMRTIATLTGWIDGPEARLAVLRSISVKFPNSFYDYNARYQLARSRVGKGSVDLAYQEYTAVANDISGLDLSDVIHGGNLSLSRALRELHFEKRIVVVAIYRSLVFQFQNNERYQEALSLCKFGRSCFDFEDDGNSSFAQLASYVLKRSVGPQAKDIGTLPGQLQLKAVHPLPGGLLGASEPLSFTVASGDYHNAQADLSTLKVSIDGLDITNNVGIEPSYDYSLSSGSNYELLTCELTQELSPGSHVIEVKVSSMKSEDLAGEEFSLNWSFTVDPTHNDSSSQSLNSTYDTTLSLRHAHQNEGANSLLTLEKIQGKATRSAVAFDLANIDLSNLSKATLVLTIDEDEHVNGWGNGRTITAQALTAPWQEGNGKSFGLKKKDAVAGSGMGATWFSPLDEDISNDSANGTLSWNGGAANAPTAPSVNITNHQTGEVAFDVTSDLLNGAENGWLISKDEENAGSKVSFYSKEGAAAAGDPELAPRLILEFGGPVASTTSPSSGLLSKLGFSSGDIALRPESRTTELRSMREHLQQSPVAALVVEQALSQTTRSHPLIAIASRTAYRSWLSDDFVRLA